MRGDQAGERDPQDHGAEGRARAGAREALEVPLEEAGQRPEAGDGGTKRGDGHGRRRIGGDAERLEEPRDRAGAPLGPRLLHALEPGERHQLERLDGDEDPARGHQRPPLPAARRHGRGRLAGGGVLLQAAPEVGDLVVRARRGDEGRHLVVRRGHERHQLLVQVDHAEQRRPPDRARPAEEDVHVPEACARVGGQQALGEPLSLETHGSQVRARVGGSLD
jgi:hypothetical protein